MSRRNKKNKKRRTFGTKTLILFFIIIGISIVGYKYKLNIKYMLKNQPKVYNLIKKSKLFIVEKSKKIYSGEKRKEKQKRIIVTQERKAFTYFRAHNIFSDRDAPNREKCGGKVYSEDKNGNAVYNWDRVNEVFDIVLEANMKPVVEFGFMPEMLNIGSWSNRGLEKS